MKKTIVMAVLGMAAVGVTDVQAQAGNILFGNYWNSHQTTGIYYANGPCAGWGAGNEISVELFYGPSTATLISQLIGAPDSITQVGWNGVTSPAPLGTAFGNYAGSGVFSHGPVQIPLTPGETYAFAIYAFGTLDGDFYSGWSDIYTGPTQATPIDHIPNLPDGLYMGSFTVGIPEPTIPALGGLGLAVLMLLRRRGV